MMIRSILSVAVTSTLLLLPFNTLALLRAGPFRLPPPTPTSRIRRIMAMDPSSIDSVSDMVLSPTSGDARTLAALWFFGGSGGGGIAVSQFPLMYDRAAATWALRGVGPSEGGKGVGISPICLYPEDIRLADLKKILDNRLKIVEIVQKGPKNSYMATRGYLSFEAFAACNPGANPLALRALFDSFNASTDIVDPLVAQEKMDAYKCGILDGDEGKRFSNDILISKLLSYSAIAFLLFLLGIATTVVIQNFYLGWFPDWPGGKNFPNGLMESGLLSIPQYWI
mmetsp:Transcript_33832/g.78124  ORF Transcript_33832/g.78124 Transcript_33832/m.78124 type:complete len:282 (-) Transcript_33832:309-1154(-)